MSATKLPTIIGLTGKLEASYGAGGSPSNATDRILLEEPAEPSLEYAYDGARQPAPAMFGYLRRATPIGRGGSVAFKVAAKGAGAAYGASVLPNIHNLLRMAGFDAAIVTTGGSETVTYTPSLSPTLGGAALASGVFNCYARAQVFPITAAYLDLAITADAPHHPVWEFSLKGLIGAIADTVVPSITYPTLTLDPPKSANVAFTLGNFTGAVLRSWSLKLGRQIGMRMNHNAAGGHGGFVVGRRTPVLEVLLEASSLQATPFHAATAIDPYNLYDAATQLDCSLQIGSVQYNKWKFTAGKVQIMAPPTEENEDGAALWRLQLQCNPATISASDDLTFLFN
jgi:hypothetical protein